MKTPLSLRRSLTDFTATNVDSILIHFQALESLNAAEFVLSGSSNAPLAIVDEPITPEVESVPDSTEEAIVDPYEQEQQ